MNQKALVMTSLGDEQVQIQTLDLDFGIKVHFRHHPTVSHGNTPEASQLLVEHSESESFGG